MKIFVLADTDEKLKAVPNLAFFEKINLGRLDVGKYQLNALAENRIYLSQQINCDTDYIGFASSRWNEKYQSRLENLGSLKPRKNEVIIADPINDDWAKRSEKLHPGMYKLLVEMAEFSGYKLRLGDTFYSNNFVCQKAIFDQFLPKWLRIFHHFFDKYGCEPPFENVWHGYKPWLHPAYFYERITMLYFANRLDLNYIVAH